MSEERISAQGVCKSFQSGSETLHALREVSISVKPKTLTVLRGRSGSGKTTLMNLLGTLDRPNSGSIFLDGREITAISESERDALRRKEIGFIFQSVALISNMSALENVDFALRVAGYDKKKRRARAEEALSFVGLAKRMQHRPFELSGGEQQRVAIARAIAHHPKIVFADEPTAEVDTNMGLQIIRVFRELVEHEGVTILMTTHDPNMMELADDVYTLEDGKITEELHVGGGEPQ